MALPEIGTPEREKLEAEALARGGELLAAEEDIGLALRRLRMELDIGGLSTADACRIADHVEQCWIGRILR